MRLSSRCLPLFVLPLLAACSSVSMPDFSDVKVTDYVTPYRIDMRQGNYVTQDMVAQLKPGLSQQQVRFILGTPLLVDAFHKDRWDYLYRFKPGRGELQTRRMTVFFEDGKLVRVAGDVAAAAPAAGGVAGDLPEASNASKVIEIAPGKDVVAAERKDGKGSDSWFAWPSWLSGSKEEKKDVKADVKADAKVEAKATTAN